MTLETFGPLYVRPPQHACPDCSCCTAELCERGRITIHRCVGLTTDDLRPTVNSCPCSAAYTAGTHAWRLERLRVTRFATQRPLPPAEEVILRELADGQQRMDRVIPARLRVAGLLAEEGGRFEVTESGRLYLAVREDSRITTPVEVLWIDTVTRTAAVDVFGWRGDVPVRMLLDQLLAETGLSAEVLKGTRLEAQANCRAAGADDVVLTDLRVALPIPDDVDEADEAGAVGGGEL